MQMPRSSNQYIICHHVLLLIGCRKSFRQFVFWASISCYFVTWEQFRLPRFFIVTTRFVCVRGHVKLSTKANKDQERNVLEDSIAVVYPFIWLGGVVDVCQTICHVWMALAFQQCAVACTAASCNESWRVDAVFGSEEWSIMSSFWDPFQYDLCYKSLVQMKYSMPFVPQGVFWVQHS